MNYKSTILEELKDLSFFTKDAFLSLGVKYGLKSTTINTQIARSLKKKDVIKLKRGLYVCRNFYEKNISDSAYVFYIANILRKPSYISLWTALQYYGLTTESIMSTTSVTTKKTMSYSNKLGGFTYNSIKENLFSNIVFVDDVKFPFFIATPAKALFDLMYFKTNQFKTYNAKSLAEFRINVGELDKTEKEKYYNMIKTYNRYE